MSDIFNGNIEEVSKIFQSPKKVQEIDAFEKFKLLTCESNKLIASNHVGKNTDFKDYKDQDHARRACSKLFKSLEEFFALNNKSMIPTICYYFSKFEHFLFILLHYFVQLDCKNRDRVIDFLKLSGEVSISHPTVLFVKDYLQLTDFQYDFLRRSLHMEHRIPPIGALANFRKKVNGMIVKELEIKCVDRTAVCSSKPAVEMAATAISNFGKAWNQKRTVSKHGNEYEKLQELNEDLIDKFTTDGFNADGTNIATFAHQILKTGIIAEKDPDTFVPVAVCIEKESPSLLNYLEDAIDYNKNAKAISVNGKEYNLNKIYNGDLMTTSHYSDMNFKSKPCFECFYKRFDNGNPFSIFFGRYFENKLGFDEENTFFCLLHCFQRSIEKLTYATTRGQKCKKDQLMMIFSAEPFLNQLRIVEKETEEEEEVEQENVREKISMMCGNAIKHLLEKHKILTPIFNEETKEKEDKIWRLFKQVWDFMQGSASSYTKKNRSDLQGVLNEIMCLYQIYGVREPLYFHYLVHHLVPMLKKLHKLGISFADIDQGSFELLNKLWKEMRRGCVPMSISKTANSKQYKEEIKRCGWIDYQEILGFKEGMSFEEYSKYKSRSLALHLLLLPLRKFYICAKYPAAATLKPVANMDRKKYKSNLSNENQKKESSILTPDPKFMFSDHQMEKWMKVPKSTSFDYEALKRFYEKHAQSIVDAKKNQNLEVLLNPRANDVQLAHPNEEVCHQTTAFNSISFDSRPSAPPQQEEELLEFHQIAETDTEVDFDNQYQEQLVTSMQKKRAKMAASSEKNAANIIQFNVSNSCHKESQISSSTSLLVVPEETNKELENINTKKRRAANAPQNLPPQKKKKGNSVAFLMGMEEGAF